MNSASDLLRGTCGLPGDVRAPWGLLQTPARGITQMEAPGGVVLSLGKDQGQERGGTGTERKWL